MESPGNGRATLLVIGGTGHFGGRICRRLAHWENLDLVVSSRSAESAANLAASINATSPAANIAPAALDVTSDSFAADVKNLAPDVVIHTAGPYQEQDHAVPRACIEAGSHYVDLADGRDFVANIGDLDEAAIAADVSIVSGASTMPGISSVMVDDVRSDFAQIHTVESSIAPAHKTPRGVSTYLAGLECCGKPFDTWRDGRWQTVHGWQDLRKIRYPLLGTRFGAACNIPDLQLMPEYVPGLQTASFHAALEAPWEQLALWLMAGLTRARLVWNWRPAAPLFSWLTERLLFLGSEEGGMHVRVHGLDRAGKVIGRTWYLLARQNHGPEIPCSPAILIARKLLTGELRRKGAYPCLGLFTIDELMHEMREFDIEQRLQEN